MFEDRPGRPDDIALVRLVASGSYDALASLYDRHGRAVFAAACRLTSDRGVAEEVVQDTFLALWDRAEAFDPAVGIAVGLVAYDRAQPDGRSPSGGRPPAAVRRAAIEQRERRLGDAAPRAGSVLGHDRGGIGRTGRPGGRPRLEGDAGVDRACAGRDGVRGTNRHRPGLSRGLEPDGDRRCGWAGRSAR